MQVNELNKDFFYFNTPPPPPQPNKIEEGGVCTLVSFDGSSVWNLQSFPWFQQKKWFQFKINGEMTEFNPAQKG